MDTHENNFAWIPPVTIDYLQVMKDPRCPQCGRAVVGGGIIGLEGTYHPECAQSPFKYAPLEPWQPPMTPMNPPPYQSPFIYTNAQPSLDPCSIPPGTVNCMGHPGGDCTS